MFIIIFLSNCVSGSIFIIFFFLAKFEDFFKKRFKKGTTGNYIIYFEIIFYLIYFDGIKLISNSIIRGGGHCLSCLAVLQKSHSSCSGVQCVIYSIPRDFNHVRETSHLYLWRMEHGSLGHHWRVISDLTAVSGVQTN